MTDTAKTSGLSKLQVSNLDHVVLWVKNLEASKRFYMDLLGFTVDHEHLGPDSGDPDPMDADYRCFLRCGPHQVGLFQRKDLSVDGTLKFNHIAMRLDGGSRNEVQEFLEQRGIAWKGRVNDPGCIYIHDPEGHMIQLLTPLED